MCKIYFVNKQSTVERFVGRFNKKRHTQSAVLACARVIADQGTVLITPSVSVDLSERDLWLRPDCPPRKTRNYETQLENDFEE
ncbi:AAEL017430-PA [Aedes aegypti]|uniref:AAEL017430-PA n=1 Tax=Aedes aegypti TaxID=7159 RepID=J9HXY7_AEDAE|nr:AAEL017430-PA [Aedes aegypti]